MIKRIAHKVLGAMAAVLLVAAVLTPLTVQADAPANQRDCNDNAILRCGVADLAELKQDYRANQGGNVQAIYNHFSIADEAALNGMVMGRVTKTNEVWVGNERVATGAMTAGRQNMPGSTPILNGQAYTRPPAVSFNSESLDALVQMQGGVFRFAVILSCGNPVTAFPVEKPKPAPRQDLHVSKRVRIQDSAGSLAPSFQVGRADAKEGNLVQYEITVTNRGDTDLQNVHIKDELPAGLRFNDDATLVQIDGTATNHSVKQLTSTGITIGSIAKGADVRYFFTVQVALPNQASGTCQVLKNVVRVKAEGVPERSAEVDVQVCKEVQPPAQVQAQQTPPTLPETGVAVLGVFSLVSVAGVALHKLKEFYLSILG